MAGTERLWKIHHHPELYPFRGKRKAGQAGASQREDGLGTGKTRELDPVQGDSEQGGDRTLWDFIELGVGSGLLDCRFDYP
mgnify:CR=1 FL=1